MEIGAHNEQVQDETLVAPEVLFGFPKAILWGLIVVYALQKDHTF